MNYKLLFFCILPLVLSCKNANNNFANKKPFINFDKQIINIGDIKSGTPFRGKFVLRNTGNAKLKIDEITTDCACTVANLANDKIAPGDSVYISFTVNPHVVGYFQQKIIIKNNSENNPILFAFRGKTI
jgi:hypothetical protein